MRWLFATLVAALATFVAAPSTASGLETGTSTTGNQITRWDETYDLQTDGSAKVRLEIDFDFGDDPGHGPYFTFPTHQGYDDTYNRIYEITDLTASSPTGAPANVYTDDGDYWLVVRIGDQDIDNVSGVQTYVLTYTVHHVMNSVTDAVPPGQTEPINADEFYWNAIGDGFEIPISNATVTVTSPVDVVAAQCFAGASGVADPCDSATSNGATATFTHAFLSPGQPMTVDLLYPAGSFDTTPQLEIASDTARAWRLSWPWVIPGLLILLVGGVLLTRALVKATRDEYYVGLTPGLAPTGADDGTTRSLRKAPPVAVRFDPPKGVAPGLVGTLWDEKADTRDVTATMVDLAVRGYLRVDHVEAEDYRLVKLKNSDATMLKYEGELFDAIFDGRNEVLLSELKTTFSKTLQDVSVQMYADVVSMGWYARSPSSTRLAWAGLGVLLLVAGFFGSFFVASIGGSVLITVPLILIGAVLIFTQRAAPVRKAEGSRVLAESKGFELFLRTADANQLRFEEGQDIFSKYLPYAIAFGIADQWTKKFQELAAAGYQVAEPNWMTGYTMGSFWALSNGFTGTISQFQSLASAAVSAPTPGSSGSSGFGGGGFGGGGFSGGGGGGGGGGGW
jgi:uncharacterized membrane protein YgcG